MRPVFTLTGWQTTLNVWQSDVGPRQIHWVHGNLWRPHVSERRARGRAHEQGHATQEHTHPPRSKISSASLRYAATEALPPPTAACNPHCACHHMQGSQSSRAREIRPNGQDQRWRKHTHRPGPPTAARYTSARMQRTAQRACAGNPWIGYGRTAQPRRLTSKRYTERTCSALPRV